jgi:hypothetical protein
MRIALSHEGTMMAYEEFRQEMNDFLSSAYDRPQSMREGTYALISVEKLYARFDEGERRMADRVLIEWLLSDQERLSSIAFYVVRHYKVSSATSALRELASRLASINTPMARDRLKEVLQLIADLAQ